MAKINKEINVGLTDQMCDALEVATGFTGMKQGQYIRQATLEKLVRESYMPHPMAQKVAAGVKG